MCARVLALFVCVVAVAVNAAAAVAVKRPLPPDCCQSCGCGCCNCKCNGDDDPTFPPLKSSKKSFLAQKAPDVVVSLMTDNVVAGVHGKDDGKDAAEAEEAKAEAEEGGKEDAEQNPETGQVDDRGTAQTEMIRCRNEKNPGPCAGRPKVQVTKDKENVEQLAERVEEDPVSLITVDGKEAAEEEEEANAEAEGDEEQEDEAAEEDEKEDDGKEAAEDDGKDEADEDDGKESAEEDEKQEDEAQFIQVERHSLSGVERTVLKAGDGIHFPKNGDTVTMHYTGTLTDGGKKFDSSVDRGQPFVTQIGVGRVIKGWDEGVVKMSLGEKAVLKMTSDYGYGASGAGADIPPNAGLTFEVELLKINEDLIATDFGLR